MAYTAPKTWVANAILTAAELNVHLRDNMLETAASKATTAGALFVATGVNAIAQRIPQSATVATSQQTTSATYTNLITPGPAVTVTSGAQALVVVSADLQNTSNSARAWMSFAVSGATTRAAQDTEALRAMPDTFNAEPIGASRVTHVKGLTPGNNTFTAVYRSTHTAGAAIFEAREIFVLPL